MTVAKSLLEAALPAIVSFLISGPSPSELLGAMVCRVSIRTGAINAAVALSPSMWAYTTSSGDAVFIADCKTHATRKLPLGGSATGTGGRQWHLYESETGAIAVNGYTGSATHIRNDGSLSALAPVTTSTQTRRLAAIDASGRQYYVQAKQFAIDDRGREVRLWLYAESLSVERVVPGEKATATLAVLRGQAQVYREGDISIDGRTVRAVMVSAFRSEEQVAVAQDGFVALVRANPYRVEWITSSGSRTVSERLPDRQITVDSGQRDVAAHAGASQWGPGIRRADASSAQGAPIPSFGLDAVHIVSREAVAIELALDAREGSRIYHVVSRSGRLSGRVTFRRSESLVGCNARSIAVWSPDTTGGGLLSIFAWKRGTF